MFDHDPDHADDARDFSAGDSQRPYVDSYDRHEKRAQEINRNMCINRRGLELLARDLEKSKQRDREVAIELGELKDRMDGACNDLAAVAAQQRTMLAMLQRP